MMIRNIFIKLNNGIAVIDISRIQDRSDCDEFYINRILVPKDSRNQGIGTKMMSDLCTMADVDGVKLYVHPTENYGSDLARLTKFLARHDFRWVERCKEMIMERKPI